MDEHSWLALLKSKFRPINRGWLSRHRIWAGFVFVATFLLAINSVAFMHAWRMTHFTNRGTRTPNPEQLSLVQRLWTVTTGVVIPRPLNRETPDNHNLGFETLRTSTADGAMLESWFVPHETAKATVVLFHGYAACKSDCLSEAAAFHEMNMNAMLVDFRGSGGSSGKTTSLGFYEAIDVDCAVRTARALSANLPIVLYAKSLGSAAVLRACAALGTTVDALILECPFDRLLSTAANRFRSMGLPAAPFAQLLVFWGGMQCGFNAFTHNPVEYASNVRTPCLLFAGQDDTRVLPAQSASIFEHLAGPKKMVIVKGAGHISYFGYDAGLWRSEVTEFIRETIR